MNFDVFSRYFEHSDDLPIKITIHGNDGKSEVHIEGQYKDVTQLIFNINRYIVDFVEYVDCPDGVRRFSIDILADSESGSKYTPPTIKSLLWILRLMNEHRTIAININDQSIFDIYHFEDKELEELDKKYCIDNFTISEADNSVEIKVFYRESRKLSLADFLSTLDACSKHNFGVSEIKILDGPKIPYVTDPIQYANGYVVNDPINCILSNSKDYILNSKVIAARVNKSGLGNNYYKKFIIYIDIGTIISKRYKDLTGKDIQFYFKRRIPQDGSAVYDFVEREAWRICNKENG